MTISYNPDVPFFDNTSGKPLALGNVYFGQPNQAPKTNPSTSVFSDINLTVQISATQALNSAGKLQQFTYIGENYSLLVEDSEGNQIFLINEILSGATSDLWRVFSGTPTQTSATTFTVTGDKTSFFTVGSRLKADDSTSLYGTIVSSVYADPITTVTVNIDNSGVLSVSLSAVYVGASTANQEISAGHVSYTDLSISNVYATSLEDLFKKHTIFFLQFHPRNIDPGDGTVDATTYLQNWASSSQPGARMVLTPPSNYYRITDTLEFANTSQVIIEFNTIRDFADGEGMGIKYHGTLKTGYENPMIRLLNLFSPRITGLGIDCGNLIEFGCWLSGTNQYSGSGPDTVIRKRLSGGVIDRFDCVGMTKCSMQIGDDTGSSSQTDILTINNAYFRAIETGIALGTPPVTYGLYIEGANTYVMLNHCQASGDYGYYLNNCAVRMNFCYALGDGGWYINGTQSVVLNGCHAEGITLRSVWVSDGETSSAKPLVMMGCTFLPGPTSNPNLYQNNMPVVMIGCMGYGWDTDNFASSHERPLYLDIGNKWTNPKDFSNNPTLWLIALTQESSGDYTNFKSFFTNKRTVIHTLVGNDTWQEGVSNLVIIGVDDGSGRTHEACNAEVGMKNIECVKRGTGQLNVTPKLGDVLIDGTTGTEYSNSVSITGSGWGIMNFSCEVENKWIVYSPDGATLVFS